MESTNILNIVDLILITSGTINLILGFLVWIRGIHKSANISYFLISIGVFIWVTNLVLFDSFRFGADVAFLFAIIAYLGALLIPISSLYFASYFGVKQVENKYVLYISSILFIIFFLITMIPGMVITNVERIHSISTMVYGPLYIPYALYVSGLFTVTFFYLYRRYYSARGRLKSQLRYVFIGTISTAGVSLITNLILPFYGNFDFFMVGPTTVTLMALFVGYAIVKYGLWDFKKILAEILIGILVVLSLANIIISPDYFDSKVIIWFKIIVVIVTILVVTMLFISFKKEQKSKRKLKRLNKRLKEMDAKKTEFLHIATHQLRGPITAIKGYTSLLRDGDYGKMEDEIQLPLQKIMSASEVMTDTINDYMDIARIEERSLKLEPEDFKLCTLVRERVEVARVNAEEKGLKLVLDIPKKAECTVHADKKNITQVINALIENAIKYTREGSVKVSGDRSKDGTMAYIHIKDSGIGIPKAELDDIFTKFSRASNAKSTNIFGTGMGLFIAQNLMRINGGDIKVFSEGAGKGSIFTIELPIVGG